MRTSAGRPFLNPFLDVGGLHIGGVIFGRLELGFKSLFRRWGLNPRRSEPKLDVQTPSVYQDCVEMYAEEEV